MTQTINGYQASRNRYAPLMYRTCQNDHPRLAQKFATADSDSGVRTVLHTSSQGGDGMSNAMHDVEIVDVEDFEAFKRFDGVCQLYLRMNGEEFVEHFKRGKFDDVDTDSIPGLSKVMSILPFAGLHLP